ncbi:hypothetical protein HDV06_004884 [Boothiomyces sp. JEL0866]|nr:hypothetical protein HDV06_004884 [Boothiomyces sp. JEL0866]
MTSYNLLPGVGILDCFILGIHFSNIGTPIGKIISFLESKEWEFQLQYCEVNPLKKDIYIHLQNNGINLTFDSESQRLKVIDIYNLESKNLTYEKQVFNSVKISPTFNLIYKVFGPIYPGKMDDLKQIYSLNYPGITFVFDIPKGCESIKPMDLPFTLSDGTTPVAKRVYIFNGPSVDQPTVKTLGTNDYYFEQVIIPISTSGIDKITLQEQNVSLLFGQTTQDVLCEIGAPQDQMEKDSDKMGIHRVDETLQSKDDYFWNYFSMGIDLVFDGSTHVLKKIIMHSNCMGHYLMNRYAKCNFKFGIFHTNLENGISHKSTWPEVLEAFGEPLGPPVIYNREDNPFGTTSFHGYDGILFEILSNNHIASVTLWK